MPKPRGISVSSSPPSKPTLPHRTTKISSDRLDPATFGHFAEFGLAPVAAIGTALWQRSAGQSRGRMRTVSVWPTRDSWLRSVRLGFPILLGSDQYPIHRSG